MRSTVDFDLLGARSPHHYHWINTFSPHQRAMGKQSSLLHVVQE
jgi:hypothetical protein